MGARVYAWFGTGQIVSLDMTGKLVWSRHLGREFSPFDINWGHSSSPTIFNDSLILICYHDTDSYLLESRLGVWQNKVARRSWRHVQLLQHALVVPSGPSTALGQARRADREFERRSQWT